MISRHGREFASNAELRRYEANNPQMPRVLNGCMCQMGECESCNRVVEAFEAMREALRQTEEFCHVADTDGPLGKMRRAALALADKVSK